MNTALGSMLKEVIVACFMVLSLHFAGETEQKDSRCTYSQFFGRILNTRLPR